jgi:hypothetical protein
MLPQLQIKWGTRAANSIPVMPGGDWAGSLCPQEKPPEWGG